MSMATETSRCRSITAPYCQGNGVDLGSGGDPVVPWAIQIDLPIEDFFAYGGGRTQINPIIQWRGDARQLPFQDQTLDFVYSSHLLEDFEDWRTPLDEWSRVLKAGGHLIIMIPDHERFRAAVAGGQPDNLAHKHEGKVGELTEMLSSQFDIITDRIEPADSYNILWIGRKQ